MDNEERKGGQRRGTHVYVECEYCEDRRRILRYRHVAHVKACHKKVFPIFWRNVGSKYPRVRRNGNRGEQGGEQDGERVNTGDHPVNTVNRAVNMIGERVNTGEHR